MAVNTGSLNDGCAVGMTESEVRLKFATEEEEEAKNGVPALHEVTPSSFVTAGLELEGQQ